MQEPAADSKVADFPNEFAKSGSHASFIAPNSDVQAVAETESKIAAEASKPSGAAVKFRAAAAFWHQ